MNTTNQFSKGCQLCQQGKWLCIFITYKCNARCHFCPAPFKNDRIQSAFGNNKEEILSYLLQNDFGGISFSGGDPFVVFDRLMEWFTYFKKSLPDYYYWVYTNGLDADERKLEQLSAEGMNEIRFNIAATGYVSAKIWKQIKIAKKLFPYVSVEIPSIKHDYNLLEVALENLNDIGVDYLNLHDYILSESDTNSSNEPYGMFTLNKINQLKYAPSSIKNTEKIINLALEGKYNFYVNHCSMQKKEIQMIKRMQHMGKVFNDPDYDIVLEDGTICNYYRIPNKLFCSALLRDLANPGFRDSIKQYLLCLNKLVPFQSSDFKIILASYVPQMEIGQVKTLINAKIISNTD